MPLHGESPARFSVIPPLGEDTRCPACKHSNEDLVHFLLTCPGLDRPPDWPKTIRPLILLLARSEQDMKAAAEMGDNADRNRSECPPHKSTALTWHAECFPTLSFPPSLPLSLFSRSFSSSLQLSLTHSSLSTSITLPLFHLLSPFLSLSFSLSLSLSPSPPH